MIWKRDLTQRILGVIARLGYGKAGMVATFVITIIVAGSVVRLDCLANVEIGDIHPGSPILWEDSDYNVAIDQINQNFPGTEELYVLFEGDTARGLWRTRDFSGPSSLSRVIWKRSARV